MSEMPKWIDEAVQDARRLFGLGGMDWHFYVKLSDKPGGDEDNDGTIYCDSVYLTANIELNTNLKDDEVGFSAVYHEVLHAAHESVDHLVQETIIKEVPEEKRELFKQLYRDGIENFVQRISRSVVGNLKKDGGVEGLTMEDRRTPSIPTGGDEP